MEQKITAFIKHHQLLEQNRTILVGVSGGPDSLALLCFLRSLREKWNLKLIALSVDHQLRGKVSRDDLEYVKFICKEWDIIFEGTSVDVASYKVAYQLGTQVAARTLRYRFFEEQMEKHQADYIALGHHADDQVETMLMNFARSSNPKALSGIPVRRAFASGMIIRPFLCVTRSEIESYCRTNGITPRIDASNEDTIYTRNAVRKNMIPLIKELNPNVHTSLQHLSESLQADEAYIQEQAVLMVDEVVTFPPGKKKASFEVASFQSYSSALQRRAYHLILNHLYSELPKNLSYTHEMNFFRLLEKHEGNKELNFPHQLKVVRTYEKVTLYDAEGEQSIDSPYDVLVNVPGETHLPDGVKLLAKLTNDPEMEGEYTYVCSNEQVAHPLHVRSRKNGDRMQWKGLRGRKKLKDIFIDYKIPLEDRATWPIVTDNEGNILWLVGLKKNQPEHVSNQQSYIQLSYQKEDIKGE